MKTNASCSVSPNPAQINQEYIVSGIGLPAGFIIDVLVTQAAGVQATTVRVNPDGTANVTFISRYTGQANAEFRDVTKPRYRTLAACAFTLV